MNLISGNLTDPNLISSIKRAYRKKALELHPDRNYGNVEDTTQHFASVQSAYEVLSDPQERAWYDTHRDTLLRAEDAIPTAQYEHNVRIATANDILRMFTQFQGKADYSDSSRGFYAVLRQSFESIAEEERLACEWQDIEPTVYPSFGYANDKFDGVVRPFYSMWNSFATRKTFTWANIYRYSEAPDRRIRRLMEKENKRLREEAMREFNDAVRSLVAFTKKRDPRFKPNIQTEGERQRILKDAAIAQAARSRKSNQMRSVPNETVPEWMRSNEIQESDMSDTEEDRISEHFECVVCRKNFKSERQYEAHERSKRHAKAVHEVRRQMQQEDNSLNFDEISAVLIPCSRPRSTDHVSTKPDTGALIGGILQERDEHDTEAYDDASGSPAISEAEAVEMQDEEQAPNSGESISSLENYGHTADEVEDRSLGQNGTFDGLHASKADVSNLVDRSASKSFEEGSGLDNQPKVGKAKQKRARKAAQKSAATAKAGSDFKCAACQIGFPSKTRLLNHIRDNGHAQPISNLAKHGKGEKP